MARTNDVWETGGDGTYIQTIGSPNGYDLLINGSNHYINFGSLVGEPGYGFRDNGGIMEFKNSGGAWTGIGSGGGGGGSGTVTSVSVVTANGFAGTVATASSTPAITITTTVNGIAKGDGTNLSAAAANTDYIAPIGAIFGGDVSMGGHYITNLLDPVNAQDAATKAYVQSLINGLAWKTLVRVATTVAGTLLTSFENGDTIDGVVLATGDRILIKDQAVQTENGIYTVNASGAPTRSTDADSGVELVGAAVAVQSGTANTGKGYVQTTPSPITIGASNIVWAQFLNTTYTNGVGLNLTGTTFSLANTAVSAGSYTFSNFTVDAQGRLTAASSTTLASAKIWVGNGSSVPTPVTPSGAWTMDNAGVATLNTALAYTWTKAQRGAFVLLTDAATIAIDASLGNNFYVALGGNRTLGVPTNLVEGQSGVIDVYQDITGTRTLAYSWCYQFAGGTAPTLSTAKIVVDQLVYMVNRYATNTCTITNASPAVFTSAAAHGMLSGDRIQLTTTGGLPTGLSVSTTYWVTVVSSTTFKVSSSLANAQAATFINTSSAGSGVHTYTSISITISLPNAALA